MTDNTAAPAFRPPTLGAIFASLMRADFRVLTKNKMRIILSLLLPLIILSTTSGTKAVSNFHGAEFILGLAITTGIAGTAIMGYAPMTARDRDAGVFQRLRVSPAPTWAVMSSRLSVQMVSNFLMSLLVLIFGANIHHLSLSSTDYLLVIVVSILGSAMFLAVAQALVGLIKSADTVQAFGRLLYIGLVFLGLFGASGSLNGTWQRLAKWSPVGALMQVFGAVIGPGQFTGQTWLSLAACACYTVVLAGLGIYWFRFDSH